MEITFHCDYAVPADLQPGLKDILRTCFPAFLADRSYYKQVPHGRLLAVDKTRVVGQVGIDYRVVRWGDLVFSLFGVVDLCVRPRWRCAGIASQLLARLEARARAGSIDVLMAIADDDRLYRRNGFFPIDTDARWLGIEERASIDIIKKRLAGCVLAKPLRDGVNLSTPVDFLGHLF
jgi:GNAT superfamily N-acetyltransferase